MLRMNGEEFLIFAHMQQIPVQQLSSISASKATKTEIA